MKVLIIEDEAGAARELTAILAQADDTIKVVAVLSTVSDALKWFEQNPQPDLMLSDIQLADGLCFEIFEKIKINSPVIFCTAFDEYLMDAFESNAVSYLLKPITRDKVEKALEKFERLKSAFHQADPVTGIDHLLRQLKYRYKTALLVNFKEKIIPVQIGDIAFFYLDKSTVHITTSNNKMYFLSASLDELEKTIDPALFYRANRQFLINRNAVSGVERFFARKLLVKLSVASPETIVVSKAKATEFLQWLEGNNQ